MMYLEHFGLQQAPVRITPHTEFFFAGANRGATLEALIYAITNDEGIVKVSGEVGSGKTMLCRMLLEKLPENVETVYLANPMLSRDEILYAIAAELRLDLPAGQGQLLLRALQDRLLEIYAAGRQIVVLIDEAHAMPPDALEEIRLLSNLESSRHKLLQIVLFGQPELDQRLHERAMRQLNDRITHSFSLEPLHRSDVAAYLMFRLRAAGYRGPDLFSRRAVQLISRSSEGLTGASTSSPTRRCWPPSPPVGTRSMPDRCGRRSATRSSSRSPAGRSVAGCGRPPLSWRCSESPPSPTLPAATVPAAGHSRSRLRSPWLPSPR